MSRRNASPGRVYLIGAGPGDPGLLTLRGADRLSRCDVVLYDGLSNPDILRHAAGADCVSVGKHGGDRIWKQSEIIDEILRHAAAGRTVGRLKGGDPAVFARSAEEIDACVAAGVPFELVPGITAALAAGSYAGIPVTHRDVASAVALVTGHEQPGKSESAIDWKALAQFPGTLVIYMGVTTAAAWTSALIDAGKDPATPAALVRRCSHHDQQQIHCRLDEVAARLTPASKFRPPVITIVGPVTELASTMHWLKDRPLFGVTVWTTRAESKSTRLDDLLQDAGARVVASPMVELSPLRDFHELDRSISDLGQTDAVVFCSDTGVREYFARMQTLGRDSRALAGTLIGAIGGKTAAELARHGLIADLVPERAFNAAAFVDQFAGDLAGKRVLVVRASRGSDTLPAGLSAAGSVIREVVAYQHRDAETIEPSVRRAIEGGEVDWIAVTSSAAATNLHRLMGGTGIPIGKMKIASLSPVTTQTLGRLGVAVTVTAESATMESLVDAVVRFQTDVFPTTKGEAAMG